MAWTKFLLDGDAAVEVTGNNILAKLQQHLGVWWFNNNWLPSGMIANEVNGTGAFVWAEEYVIPYTGTTSSSYAAIYKSASGLSYGYTWDKKRYFGLYVYFSTYSYQNVHLVSGNIYSYISDSNTQRHIGFKLINANLYGTVGNGTTESTLLLETLTATAYRGLEVIFTPGTEARFYVNGVDKGTIRTNLPTTTGYADYMLKASISNTEAASKSVRIYESRTFQEQ